MISSFHSGVSVQRPFFSSFAGTCVNTFRLSSYLTSYFQNIRFFCFSFVTSFGIFTIYSKFVLLPHIEYLIVTEFWKLIFKFVRLIPSLSSMENLMEAGWEMVFAGLIAHFVVILYQISIHWKRQHNSYNAICVA